MPLLHCKDGVCVASAAMAAVRYYYTEMLGVCAAGEETYGDAP